MMFNQKQFEDKVYELVTTESNKVFSKLLKWDENTIQKEGLKTQRKMLESMHQVIEELVTQNTYGFLARQRRAAK